MRMSFSAQFPTLQLAWDSTSIGEFKCCPRRYYYSIIVGSVLREESVHLTFGLRYHEGLEAYDKAKAMGATHSQAVREAVRVAMLATWNSQLQRPWASDHKYKNRFTLIRSIVWYLDKFEENPLQTVILSNGKPAVELSFRLELDRNSKITGEPMLLCGHIDRLALWETHIWIIDRKTTAYTISSDFFDRYSPDNQFSTYSYAGRIIYSDKIYGIIADVAQIQVEGTKYHRGFVLRTPQQLEEWRSDLDYWIDAAESCAEKDYWPQNDKACGLYGGCPYRGVCGKSPGVRADWLKAGFVNREWDPLKIRGDV